MLHVSTLAYSHHHRYALQKLTLVGLIVFFQPGTLEQLTLGLIVCFVYFGLCCYLQPFGSLADNLMVCVTQFSLFIAMLAAIIIEHGSPDVPQSVVTILSVAAFTPVVLSLLLTAQLLFNELGIHPLGLAWRLCWRLCRGNRQGPAVVLRPNIPPEVDSTTQVTAERLADIELPNTKTVTPMVASLQTEMDALRLSLQAAEAAVAEEKRGREEAERGKEAAEAQLQQMAETDGNSTALTTRVDPQPTVPAAAVSEDAVFAPLYAPAATLPRNVLIRAPACSCAQTSLQVQEPETQEQAQAQPRADKLYTV